MNALESDFVPHILQCCNAIGGRAVFSTDDPEEILMQISARRRKVEKQLLEIPEVSSILAIALWDNFVKFALLSLPPEPSPPIC